MKPLLLCLALLLPSLPALAQPKPDFLQRSAATLDVAQRYFDTYIARDWDRADPLLADTARFEDPTASTVFGSTPHEGKAVLLSFFRKGFAGITAMHFTAKEAPWASGEHAVFHGELDWTLRFDDGLEVRTRMPLITRIRVRDGKVVEHVDTADYRPFIRAVRAARAQRANAAVPAAAGSAPVQAPQAGG